MNVNDDLLQEALEGRVLPGPSHSEVDSLVRLAERVSSVHVPGPSAAASARLAARFAGTMQGRRDRSAATWLLGWFGAGPRPRAMVQRFAAGAVLLVAAGGGAGAATGTSPLAAVDGVIDFTGNAIRNLAPSSDQAGPEAAQDPTPAPFPPTPTPTAAAPAVAPPTPTPTPTPEPPTPEPTPTPLPAPSGGFVPAAPTATPAPATPAPATPVPATPTPLPPTPTGSPSASPSLSPTPTPTTPIIAPPPPTSTVDTSTPTPSSTPASTATPTPSPTQILDQTFSAGAAGTVTVRRVGSNVDLKRINPNPGWQVVDQNDKDFVTVVFARDDDDMITFKAEVKNGELKITVSGGN